MDTIYKILAYPLTLFYSWTGNYVVSMILYAILIKIILFPFGIKQQKNSIKQASLRPKEQAVRNQYKGKTDRESQMQMQQELQDLYKRENYNPMSGCLPMLIQLPVIWILYRIVYGPLSYIKGISKDLLVLMAEKAGELGGQKFAWDYQLQWVSQIKNNFNEFTGMVSEAGEKFAAFFPSLNDFDKFFDGFKLFGLDLTAKPWDALGAMKDGFSWGNFLMIIIPVLVFASQIVSMKVVRKLSYQPISDPQSAKSMKIMDWTMPAFTLYLSFILPGILGVYWIVNALLGILQQFILKKIMPVPEFSEEDYKKAERELKSGVRPTIKRSEKVINPKSLHHIDDDDDE